MGDGGPELEDIEDEDGEGGQDLEKKFKAVMSKSKLFCSCNHERKPLEKKVRAFVRLSYYTIYMPKFTAIMWTLTKIQNCPFYAQSIIPLFERRSRSDMKKFYTV